MAYALLERAEVDEILRTYFAENWESKLAKTSPSASTGIPAIFSRLIQPTISATDRAIADAIKAALAPEAFDSKSFAIILNDSYAEAKSHLLVNVIFSMAEILAK